MGIASRHNSHKMGVAFRPQRARYSIGRRPMRILITILWVVAFVGPCFAIAYYMMTR